jgi:hypothetical protein
MKQERGKRYGKGSGKQLWSDALLLSDEKEAPPNGSASALIKFYSVTLTDKKCCVKNRTCA